MCDPCNLKVSESTEVRNSGSNTASARSSNGGGSDSAMGVSATEGLAFSSNGGSDRNKSLQQSVARLQAMSNNNSNSGGGRRKSVFGDGTPDVGGGGGLKDKDPTSVISYLEALAEASHEFAALRANVQGPALASTALHPALEERLWTKGSLSLLPRTLPPPQRPPLPVLHTQGTSAATPAPNPHNSSSSNAAPPPPPPPPVNSTEPAAVSAAPPPPPPKPAELAAPPGGPPPRPPKPADLSGSSGAPPPPPPKPASLSGAPAPPPRPPKPAELSSASGAPPPPPPKP